MLSTFSNWHNTDFWVLMKKKSMLKDFFLNSEWGAVLNYMSGKYIKIVKFHQEANISLVEMFEYL